MEQINIEEEALKNSLKSLFGKEDFILHQQLIRRLSAELQVSFLDCAAALSLLNQPELLPNKLKEDDQNFSGLPSVILPKQKEVRYRIDVGRKHSVSMDEIKNILIEVAGVDKNRIGKLDIRNYYSLVDLPDGMPADVFQLLSEVEINQQRFNLKRIKYQPRFYRRNNKNHSNFKKR